MCLNYFVKGEKASLFLNVGQLQIQLDRIIDVACVRNALQKASKQADEDVIFTEGADERQVEM